MQDNFSSFHNLIEPLQLWASSHPHQIAFRFLADGKTETGRLSYLELNWQAQAIGDHLRHLGLQGEPVILLYPPGLEFISAFFGSIYNNNLLIPLPLPRAKNSLSYLHQVVSQTHARAVLSTGSLISRLKKSVEKDSEFPNFRCYKAYSETSEKVFLFSGNTVLGRPTSGRIWTMQTKRHSFVS